MTHMTALLFRLSLLCTSRMLIRSVGALEHATTSTSVRVLRGETSSAKSDNSDGDGFLLSHTTIVVEQQQQDLLRQRKLDTFDNAPLSSQGRIAWFCFVAVCIIAPLACCMIFCACKCRTRQEQARFEQEEQANTAISRIEANVKVFAEIEDQRRLQSIRRTMKRHLFTVRMEDLMDSDSLGAATMTASCFRKELSSGCSICLEPFKVGDTLIHSIDVDACRHVFHEMCVCEWLVKQSTTVCPCCRQEFVGTETPVTSLSSNEQFQAAFDADQGSILPPPSPQGEEDEGQV